MFLFKRKPPPPAAPPPAAPALGVPAEIPPVERRSAQRFKVQPGFPVKAVLNFIPRDDTGAPVSTSRHGWHWKGSLLDVSEQGMRVLMGAGVKTGVGETCELRLCADEFELNLACTLTNLREAPEGVLFGLRLEFADPEAWQAYRRILEAVAMSAQLKPRTKAAQPDESGYVVEKFASNRPSSLTVWRHPEDGTPSAFEFIMGDWSVRAAAGQGAEYFSNDDTGSRPATSFRTQEIHRWFQWTTGNLPPCVPADVQAFVRGFAK